MIRFFSGTKPNSGVIGLAIVFAVTNDTDPGFGFESTNNLQCT